MKPLAHRLTGLLFCLVVGLTPLAAEPPAPDPAVAEVLAMLGSGVSETVVFRWVSAAGNAPKVVSADDVIALTRAGASDDLLELMIDLAEKAPTSLESVDRGAAADAARPTPEPPVDAARVETRFEIEYRPRFAANTPEPWDLYVYLDGEPLAWLAKGGQLDATPPARFVRQLAPGTHVLRLLLENHERRSGERWFHEAQVAPTQILFRLAAGAEAQVEVRVAPPRFGLGGLRGGDKGPITAEIRQAGKVVASFTEAGGQIADWPELCEEIEANLDPAKKVPARLEKALGRCTRWAELWRGLEREVPSRDEARARLEKTGFRPAAR